MTSEDEGTKKKPVGKGRARKASSAGKTTKPRPRKTATGGKKTEGQNDDSDDQEVEKPKQKKAKITKPVSKSQPKSTSKADATKEDLTTLTNGVLERGHIYFFYRPKVTLADGESPSSLDDVANFHFLLLPRDGGYRFVVIGKKRLPDRSKGGREVFWGTVERCGADLAEKGENLGLGGRSYQTKTRGATFVT